MNFSNGRTLRLAFILTRIAARERDFSAKLDALANKFSKSLTRDFIENTLIPLDPSPTKKYLEWICREYSNGNIIDSDFINLPHLLQTYLMITNRPSDANRFYVDMDISKNTIQDLYALDKLINGISPELNTKKDGYVTIYDTPPYKIYRVGGPGIDLKAAIQAAMKFGGDTEWCTGGEDYATTYLKREPLYVIFREGKKFAQSASTELRRRDDSEISFNEMPQLFRLLFLKHCISKGYYYVNQAYYSNEKMNTDQVNEIAKYVRTAYEYAKNVLKGPFPLGEPAIAKDAEYALAYARNVLNGPFPKGEPAIAKHGGSSLEYAVFCLKGPFPLGEPEIFKDERLIIQYVNLLKRRIPDVEAIISQNSQHSLKYAQAIGGRFPLGEPAIAKDDHASYNYAVLLNERFPLGEDAIATSATFSINYVKKFGRVEKCENAIARDVSASFMYARDVLHGRFPKGEPTIAKSSSYSLKYAEFLGHRFELGEDAIAKNTGTFLLYVQLFGRLPKAEEKISRNAYNSLQYAQAIRGRFPLGEPAIFDDANYARHYIAFIKKTTGENLYNEYLKHIGSEDQLNEKTFRRQ